MLSLLLTLAHLSTLDPLPARLDLASAIQTANLEQKDNGHGAILPDGLAWMVYGSPTDEDEVSE